MYCNYCGKQIPESGSFCPYCGKALIGLKNSQTKVIDKDSTKKVMKRIPYSIITFITIFFLFFTQIMNKAVSRAIDVTEDPTELLILSLIAFLPAVVLFLYGFFCVARRLRDCGKNPYYAWFIIIPLFGLIYMIYLCFPKSRR